jgi:hypothetical protein
MAQCPGCQKFPALTTDEDPEVELEISGRTVQARIRLVRMSECCSEEMKEANMEPEVEIDTDKLAGHVDKEGEEMEGHDLSVEETSKDITERCVGKGRGRRTFHGVTVNFSISCSCQDTGAAAVYEGSISDECQASSMDELT